MDADKIQIVKITLVEPKPGSSLRAFANIKLGAIEIRGLRVMRKDGGRAWIGMPQREGLMNGEKKFFNVVEISNDDLKDLIDQKVLDSWRARKIATEDHANQPEEDPVPF